MLYFAYSSNMDLKQLRNQIGKAGGWAYRYFK